MLQAIEELSPTKRKLRINVPKDVVMTETNNAYNELKATAKIPGFRPGKVPHSILVKKFGKNVEAQLIEKLVPQFYMKAVQEAAIEPVSYPSIDEKIELKPGEPLSFTVTVEIKPEISDLNFEGITLKEKTFTLDEADVERSIESMRESRALFTVTEEGLGAGDMAILDSEAYIDDQLKEELTYKEFPFVIGTDSMPKEFSDALIGKKKDETADVKISFEAGHSNRTIAGKEVTFRISVKEAKKKHLPPLDEEFAKESDCKDMEEVREKIRGNLRKRLESGINLQYKQDILNDLIKRHDFAAPESMVEGELKSLIEKVKEDAMRKGGDVKSDEELAQELVQTAKDNIKGVILLEAIGRKEKVEVTDSDVKEAIAEIAGRNNLKPEEVTRLYSMREGSMDALKSRLFADKVLEHILGKASIEKG